MEDDPSVRDDGDTGSGRPGAQPGPTHPWGASIVLVAGVVVLLLALALASTIR
jgi:hypothetical protein